jgi:hypothetical protein
MPSLDHREKLTKLCFLDQTWRWGWAFQDGIHYHQILRQWRYLATSREPWREGLEEEANWDVVLVVVDRTE